MQLKKHSAFSFTLIATLFLFLNVVCSTAPLFKISFENCQFANTGLFQNPAEAAEENALQTSSYETRDSKFYVRHFSPNRLFKKDSNSIAFDHQKWRPNYSFISYNLLLRPGYYHFLFRHNLF
jgi:hypothetical protein